MSSMHERFAAILVEKFGLGADEISPTSTLEDLEMDSLALVELVVSVQKEFGVVIDDSELPGDATVADVIALIGARQQEAA
ncbi:acyl carrier protein [Streptomyces cellulosae]|uniref:acyl carrier protein n=1 Tax=Streptomyces cellulosae TaxID=1968 RepID=UPI0004CBED7E|nr:acyl carrier protein [Streptomyces cellulosae]